MKKIRLFLALISLTVLAFTFSTNSEAAEIQETTTARYVVDGNDFKVEVGNGYEYLLEEATVSFDNKKIPLVNVEPIEIKKTTYTSESGVQPYYVIGNGQWYSSSTYYVPKNAVTYATCYSNVAASKTFGCYRGNTLIISTSGSTKNLDLSGVRIFTAGNHQWRVRNTSSVSQDVLIRVSF